MRLLRFARNDIPNNNLFMSFTIDVYVHFVFIQHQATSIHDRSNCRSIIWSLNNLIKTTVSQPPLVITERTLPSIVIGLSRRSSILMVV